MMKSIKKHFLAYFTFTIVAIILVTWEFSFLTKTKEREKIDILINSISFDFDAFQEIITDKPSYLKEINYRHNDAQNGMISQVMMTYGDIEADLYILSNETLKKIDMDHYFLPLNIQETEDLFGTQTYYFASDDCAYGILFEPTFIQDESLSYYLLFANDSLHLGPLNHAPYDGAITIAKKFLRGG